MKMRPLLHVECAHLEGKQTKNPRESIHARILLDLRPSNNVPWLVDEMIRSNGHFYPQPQHTILTRTGLGGRMCPR